MIVDEDPVEIITDPGPVVEATAPPTSPKKRVRSERAAGKVRFLFAKSFSDFN